ncbi:unnamed protein product [Heterosigma akashiwo]
MLTMRPPLLFISGTSFSETRITPRRFVFSVSRAISAVKGLGAQGTSLAMPALFTRTSSSTSWSMSSEIAASTDSSLETSIFRKLILFNPNSFLNLVVASIPFCSSLAAKITLQSSGAWDNIFSHIP